MDYKYLAELRIQAGYTQQEVADILGVTKSTISKYEKGLRNIKSDYIEKLGELYRVEPIYILTGKSSTEWKDRMNEEMEKSKEEERSYWESVLMSEQVLVLMSLLDQLNEDGQQKAIERIRELTEIPRYRNQAPHEFSADNKEPHSESGEDEPR